MDAFKPLYGLCPICHTEMMFPRYANTGARNSKVHISMKCPTCGLVLTSRTLYQYYPQKVIFNEPATIVLWNDGTKTVVKRQEDDAREFDPEVGYAMCYLKKLLGNTGNFNNIFRNKVYLEAIEGNLDRSVTSVTSDIWNALGNLYRKN